MYHINYRGWGCTRITSLSPPVIYYWPFQGGGSDVVSVACFGIRISVMFHLMFVHYTFSSVWVTEWPLFGKWLPARLAICSHWLLFICNFYIFPILVLRAGFGFWLPYFLFVAFLLLSHGSRHWFWGPNHGDRRATKRCSIAFNHNLVKN